MIGFSTISLKLNTAHGNMNLPGLNLSYTVMSKRKLLELVKEGHVNGWDDPRMPTISGMRRRGYTPESIRNFAERVGVAKRENVIDVGLLEFSVREHLNKITPRIFAVLDPLKVIITNYPEGQVENLHLEVNPEDPDNGIQRCSIFKGNLYRKRRFYGRSTYKVFPARTRQRSSVKGSLYHQMRSFKKDEKGNISEIYCTYDPETRSGSGSQRKVKGTLHWVSANHAIDAEIRLYDRLFINEFPDEVEDEGKDFKANLNPDSLKVIIGKIEPSMKDAKPLDKFQFQRLGYFCVDPDSNSEKLVFNRTVTLKDAWTKLKLDV